MEPGSLLNSRPIYGLRWYGFGNVTFAAYAGAVLVLAGWVAHRLLPQGRRRAAVVAVAALGFGAVVCEGWPSMGSDFGGVVALTPAVLWLVPDPVRDPDHLAAPAAGRRWPPSSRSARSRWPTGRAGPDRRSHLGNFVQRILDGDALDVVSRKAVASYETIASAARGRVDPRRRRAVVRHVPLGRAAAERAVHDAASDARGDPGGRRPRDPGQRRRHRGLAARDRRRDDRWWAACGPSVCTGRGRPGRIRPHPCGEAARGLNLASDARGVVEPWCASAPGPRS